MTEETRPSRWFSYRLWVALTLIAGVVISLFSYRLGRIDEAQRAEAEFVHRATLRHTLTREILVHYEDALFALTALFTPAEDVTREEFAAATSRIGTRITGVQAFEWVPAV